MQDSASPLHSAIESKLSPGSLLARSMTIVSSYSSSAMPKNIGIGIIVALQFGLRREVFHPVPDVALNPKKSFTIFVRQYY